MKFICVFLFSLVALVVQGQKDDEKVFKHPLTDMANPADDIATTHYFPDHTDNKFPVGEAITTLCYFSNEGASFYNVSAIMGSLNSPMDFRHHFQNYSYKPVGMVVKAGEEISIQYPIPFHADLEPVEYQLAITVFYESETESFSTTFFNQTVELYSPVSDYDLETVMSVLVSILFSAAVVLISIMVCSPDTKIPLFSYGKKENTTAADNNIPSDDDSWIPVEPRKKKHLKKATTNKE